MAWTTGSVPVTSLAATSVYQAAVATTFTLRTSASVQITHAGALIGFPLEAGEILQVSLNVDEVFAQAIVRPGAGQATPARAIVSFAATEP